MFHNLGGDQRGFGAWGYASGCDCGCEPSFRRFVSAKEEKEWLEKYRDEIKKELVAVEERIKGFKKD
jgi:hypothetical protein